VVLDLIPGGTVAVLSPHLDDAVLSLGPAIATWARAGSQVRIVTALAGRPGSRAAAGPWDAASGFDTEGAAMDARRREDLLACAEVGAIPVWLDFADGQYDRGGDDDIIWEGIRAAVGDAATVLSPGFPLSHPDHAWLGLLAFERRDPAWRFGLYVEQPYAIGSGRPRDHLGRLGIEPDYAGVRAPWRARRAKRRALLAYRSQHAPLAEGVSGPWRGVQRRIDGIERHRGGEGVAWVTS
jgi:LmbE family N-acetylglucosaminyl deacetylase